MKTYPFEVPSGVTILPQTSGLSSIGSTSLPFSGIYANTINGGALLYSQMGEVPAGAINNVNTTYTLSYTPYAGMLQLFENGLRLTGGGVDYNLSSATITMTVAPVSGTKLLADYGYEA